MDFSLLGLRYISDVRLSGVIMETIKVIDFTEFKRGMLGLLKLLMHEAMESQRLDHYAMYKAMKDIADEWQMPTGEGDSFDAFLGENDEAIARMILNFPRDTKEEDPPDYA